MHAIELPVDVLVSFLSRDNAGEPHAILAGQEGYVRRQRAAEDERVELRRGDEFRDMLALIHRAEVEYYGWVDAGAESFGVLVATRGRAAVRMVRHGDRVTVGHADPEHPARSLVALLPDIPPGRGPSISARAVDFGPSSQAGFLRQAMAARPHEARRMDDLLREPRLGGARLYAAVRDHTGRRRRAERWLTVLDLVHLGRWLIFTTTGADDRAVNAVPGTPDLIVGKLTDLRRSASRGGRR